MSSEQNKRPGVGENNGADPGERREIELILGASSDPTPPADAVANLMTKVARTPQEMPESSSPVWGNPFGVGRLAAASTLAASLIIGIYAGTLGTLDPVIADLDASFAVDDDGLSDPFDLDSLLQEFNGETG